MTADDELPPITVEKYYEVTWADHEGEHTAGPFDTATEAYDHIDRLPPGVSDVALWLRNRLAP